MTYELFFRAMDGEITLPMFQNYFKKHRNYRVEAAQAVYENEDTGVHFVFRYMRINGKGQKNVRSEGTYRIALNVNYRVPAFFIMEALYEVETLIDETSVVIYDPQPGGVGLKSYDGEKMFDSWMEQNERAIRQWAIENIERGQKNEAPIVSYDWLQSVWNWNYNKPFMQQSVGDNVYVPSIMIFSDAEQYKAGIVWKNGMPIAMPKVDIVVIGRRKRGENKVEYCTVDYEEIKVFVQKHLSYIEGNAYVMSYESVPQDIKTFIAKAKPTKEFKLLKMDDILEDEVVEDALFPDGLPDF